MAILRSVLVLASLLFIADALSGLRKRDEPDKQDVMRKRVARMSQSVQKLYVRAEDRVTETEKAGTSDEVKRAAEQAVHDFTVAFDKEVASEAKLGEQDNEEVKKNEEEVDEMRMWANAQMHKRDNEKVKKNEEEAVRAKASQSQTVKKLYTKVKALSKESAKAGASDEAKKAADQAKKDVAAAFDAGRASQSQIVKKLFTRVKALQDNEKVKKNEEKAVRAQASQSETVQKLYTRAEALIKESDKDGASDEVKRAAVEAKNHLADVVQKLNSKP